MQVTDFELFIDAIAFPHPGQRPADQLRGRTLAITPWRDGCTTFFL
jgi:hypothetical protein